MEWKHSTLGDICDQVGGIIQTGPFGSQLHESDYSEEGIPVVMPKDIIGNRVVTDSVARVAPEHIERLSRHKLLRGDIVYGRRGDIGRQALIQQSQAGWLCGTGCLRISLGNSIIEPLFLHYYLSQEGVIAWISNQAVGATLPNLNTGILRSVPVRFPPLPIQRKIASILSAYDDLIENNGRRIKILEQMARTIYREWFVNFRFPGHEKTKFVDSPMGKVPEGWGIGKISDISTHYRGKSYRSSELSSNDGLPFINLKCVERGGGFRIDGLKKFVGNYKATNTCRTDDVVIAITDMTQERRLVGHAARVPRLPSSFGVMSMDLLRIAPKHSISSHYLHGLLRYSDFPDNVSQHANGVNVLHLSPAVIENYNIVIPSSELSNHYGDIAASLYSVIDALQEKNANLSITRDLLLPRLISGDLEVGR